MKSHLPDQNKDKIRNAKKRFASTNETYRTHKKVDAPPIIRAA